MPAEPRGQTHAGRFQLFAANQRKLASGMPTMAR
jgi:hypothetical protein